MLRVITLNLNGIRSAYRKGVGEWLAAARPNIVCFQEVRASESDITAEMRHPGGLKGEFVLPEKRGYSGVGVFTSRGGRQFRKYPKKDSILNEEGRYLRMDFDDMSVVSLYMPSGSSGEVRQEVKFRVMEELLPRLKSERRRAAKEGREFLICGDINIAHTEKDIRNWRGNRKNSGFLPEEREWMSKLFGESGWVDVFRCLNDNDGEYTWWSNRGRAREKNVGWRIDYQIATPGLASRARRAEIYKAQRFSDHAPLIIDYANRRKKS